MQTYKEFRPTCFNAAGAFLEEERQDWFVVPCGRTRDSGELDQSNFDTALAILGGESETCEVHRFGHWGPGWFEIIIVHPSRESEVEAIQESLENYPVLDDEDFSRREWEAYAEGWESYGAKDFVRLLAKEFELSGRCKELLEDCPNDTLREFFESCIPSGEYYIGESSGVCVNLRSAIHGCTRSGLAGYIRGLRAKLAAFDGAVNGLVR